VINPQESKDPDEYPVVCPICKERLKQMNSSHLRNKHNGMTKEEFEAEYGDYSLKTLRSNSTDYVERMVGEITGYLARDDELSEDGKISAGELVQNQDAKLRLVLNLMATAQVGQLGTLNSKLLSIRKVMLDPRRLAGSSDADLLRIAKYVDERIDSTISLVKSLSIDKRQGVNALFEKNVINVFSGDPNAPKLPETSRGREQVGEILRALMNLANERRLADGGIIDADFAVVGQEQNNGGNSHQQIAESPPDAGGEKRA